MKFPFSNRGEGQDLAGQVLTPIFARLVALVEKRYGCRLDYFPAESFAEDELIKTLAVGRQPLRLNGHLYFPVFAKDRLRGLAAATENERLSADQIRELFDVILLVLESTILTTSSLETLDSLERHLHAQSATEGIVQLASRRNRLTTEPTPRAGFTQRATDPNRYAFSCLIEGPSEDDILKMALEIHERSGRYAFLRLSDLQPDSLSESESFFGLGAASLFIPDVARLTTDQQAQILARLLNPRTDGPHFIAGSLVSKMELVQERGFSPLFLDRIGLLHLRMTAPFAEYRRRGLTEFVFDAFTGPTC